MTAWIWEPNAETLTQSNIAATLRARGLRDFDDLYRWSVDQPEGFWEHVIEILKIRMHRPPQRILDLSGGVTCPVWLAEARLNIAESCFGKSPDAIAVVSGAENGGLRTVTYGQLREQALAVAGALRRMGIEPGDAVAMFMPMTARCVAIYLGILLAGGVVVSIADSFSAEQVATRLSIGGARALFTMHCVRRGAKTFSLYERAMDAGARQVIVVDADEEPDVSLREGDVPWSMFVHTAPGIDVHIGDPADPINILFSSGTTGEPKAIPWDATTAIKSAADGHFHHDIRPGDVVCWPTNIGWMMGPWLIFASLINRATIALYEGSPLERGFGHFVQNAGVSMLGLVPSLVRKWRDTGCMEGLDWSGIRTFSSTGECSNADDMTWLSRFAGGRPIIEYCGGTEIGGGYITSTVVQPNLAGAFSTPALGNRFVILDEQDRPADRGELFLIPPAMGLSRRLINRDHDEAYHQGVPRGPDGDVLRRHGDEMQRLANGYYRALGRADDTMNLGGIKIGAAEIERAVAGVGDVTEVAAIAVPAEGGGPSRLVICAGSTDPESVDTVQLRHAMNAAIREKLNPLFKVHEVVMAGHLPRTASNKIMRRVLRDDYLKRNNSQDLQA